MYLTYRRQLERGVELPLIRRLTSGHIGMG